MKHKILSAALAAACLAATGFTVAQDREVRPPGNGPRAGDGPPQRMAPGKAGPGRHHRGPRHMVPPRAAVSESGAGPEHDIHVGDRLPAAYRDKGYIVDDWRGHGLTAPPRGHHWVQIGADYVLVVAASGKISALSLGR